MKKAAELKEIDLKGMGRRIRTQREAVHMTRVEVATKLGVSTKFVADIEYGDKGVSIQTLYRLTQILNLSADYILRGDSKAGDDRDPEVERIKENILGPLSTCTPDQLRCMEQIARYYVEGIVGKGK
jgi:transcriptional regulator with XRE-family HTH domain